MTALLIAAYIAALLWLIGTLATLLIGLIEYASAAESLGRADTYLSIAEKVRNEARADLAAARKWIRQPYLWPKYLADYAFAMRTVVAMDEESRR